MEASNDLQKAIANSGMTLEEFQAAMEVMFGKTSRLSPMPPPTRLQRVGAWFEEAADFWFDDLFMIVGLRTLGVALVLLAIGLSSH